MNSYLRKKQLPLQYRKEVIPLKENKRKQKNDAILIASLLLVSALGLTLLLCAEKGDTVTVTVDKTVYGTYPLDRDAEIPIRSEIGYNLLIIRDGEAFVESASCPDGICVSHRPIASDGESIICLPNKVVISVSSENSADPSA